MSTVPTIVLIRHYLLASAPNTLGLFVRRKTRRTRLRLHGDGLCGDLGAGVENGVCLSGRGSVDSFVAVFDTETVP